jgi:hypothetical protein
VSDHNYRPDLWGHVEGRWRTAPPAQDLIDEALKTQCPDCNVNVFIEEHKTDDGEYTLIIAHDNTCPWLAEHGEQEI